MAKNSILFHAINEETRNLIDRFNLANFARAYFRDSAKIQLTKLNARKDSLESDIETAGLANKPIDKLVKELSQVKSAIEEISAKKAAVNKWAGSQIRGNKKQGIEPVYSMLPNGLFKSFQKLQNTGSDTVYRKDIRVMVESFGLEVDEKCIKDFSKRLSKAVGTVEKSRDKDILSTGESVKDTEERPFNFLMAGEVCRQVTRKCNKLTAYTNDTHKAVISFTKSETEDGQVKYAVDKVEIVPLTDAEKKAVADAKAEAEAKKSAKKSTKKSTK